MEEIRVTGENHRPVTSQWQTVSTYNVMSTEQHSGIWISQLVMLGTYRHKYTAYRGSMWIQIPHDLDHGGPFNFSLLIIHCTMNKNIIIINDFQNIMLCLTPHVLLCSSLHCMLIQFVIDLWQVCGFLPLLWFPPSIKLTTMIHLYNWNIVDWLIDV
jgi:hypothetical protein